MIFRASAASALLLLGLLAAQESAPVKVADMVADFSIGRGNPNGNWSYGSSGALDSAFTKSTVPINSGDLICWGATQGTPCTSTQRAIIKNRSQGNITPLAGIVIPNNVLHLHPGQNGEYAVVRWTAPEAGLYTVSGFFEGLNSRPTSTDVHVVMNSETVFDAEVSTFMNPMNFDVTHVLRAGDTIEFAVGFGSDRNFFYDSTGVSAKILRSR